MKMLVTYDGSPASRVVLEPAARLARAAAAEIVLLRVLRPPLDLVAHPDEQFRESELRKLETEWKAELAELGRGLECPVQVEVRRLGKRWNVVDEDPCGRCEPRCGPYLHGDPWRECGAAFRRRQHRARCTRQERLSRVACEVALNCRPEYETARPNVASPTRMPRATPTATRLRRDTNHDGAVNSIDAALIRQYGADLQHSLRKLQITSSILSCVRPGE